MATTISTFTGETAHVEEPDVVTSMDTDDYKFDAREETPSQNHAGHIDIDDQQAAFFAIDRQPSLQASKELQAPEIQRRNRKPTSGPFECSYCGKTFRWQSKYTQHVRTHTGEKPFICKECGDDFTTSSYLKAHMRTHVGDAPYPCLLCDAGFHESSLLREHRQTHIDAGAFRCDECQINFTSGKKLGQHRTQVHARDRHYKCTQCPASFLRIGHLETHMRTHTGEKPFSCKECGASFTTSGSLTVHIRTHTGEKPFACDECGKAFVTSSLLKKHKKTHNKIKYKVIDSNLNAFHLAKKDTKTSGSGEGETTLDEANQELSISDKKNVLKCDECEGEFGRSCELASHMRHRHPTSRKENICPECGMVFLQENALKTHLRTHPGVKPFKCEICERCFTQKSNLTAHLKTHTRKKPLKW